MSFLMFLACSECVLVSMSVSMKQLYIQLLLCISKLVPDADSASRSHADPERAPWIDPTIGAHLWDQGTGGDFCWDVANIQCGYNMFLGNSWGNFGLIQCQDVRTRRVTE